MTPSPIVARSRARQAAALQAAEGLVVEKRGQRTGKSKTQLAAELGMSYDQYGRYVAGVTPLRFDQIELFARLYGLDPQVLGRAILTGDVSEIVPAVVWDMAAYLAPHIPAADIPAMVERHKNEPPESQRFAADGYIRLANRARARSRNRPA